MFLDFRAWNKKKSQYLISCFTDENGAGTKLNAWVNAKGEYSPKNSAINFAEVKDGTAWMCTIMFNSKNNLVWTNAEPVENI